ncbi:MAG: hypothetical protein K6E20_05165, partial [Acholeplasmatales bacterium]|nr:hypothetical protein [Acholeplasmatales bacterium]
MLDSNKIFYITKRHIDNDCIVLNSDSLRHMLEIKLNDDEFVNSLPKEININVQIKSVEEIASKFSIDCNQGLKILNEIKSKQKADEVVDNLLLKAKTLYNQLNNYNGQRIDKIKYDYSQIEDAYSSLVQKNFNKTIASNLKTMIDSCKDLLDNVTSNYVSDIDYKIKSMDEFTNNVGWFSKNGIYTSNLFFSRDLSLNYEPKFNSIYDCIYLPDSSDKQLVDRIYSP